MAFKTPVPIQPMKAIGTAAISHTGVITVNVIWASGLFTGLFWLVMGLTGAVTRIARITSRPVVHGIILGLGLSFILEGMKMMEDRYVMLLTAGVSMWNMGVGYIAGLVLWYAFEGGWLKA